MTPRARGNEMEEGNVTDSVDAYIQSVVHPQRKEDSLVLRALMEELSGEPARMMGKTIVGFGHYEYVLASGEPGTWMRIGFAPRKNNMSVYLMAGFDEKDEELLAALGKHKVGSSCLNINKLSDVDTKVLRELISRCLQRMKKKYG